jgi:hypothetical protein
MAWIETWRWTILESYARICWVHGGPQCALGDEMQDIGGFGDVASTSEFCDFTQSVVQAQFCPVPFKLMILLVTPDFSHEEVCLLALSVSHEECDTNDISPLSLEGLYALPDYRLIVMHSLQNWGQGPSSISVVVAETYSVLSKRCKSLTELVIAGCRRVGCRRYG